MDWCTFFANVEKDPYAIVPQLTIRDLMAAKEHVQGCDTCYNRTERVLAKEPKKRFPERGKN